MQIAISGASGLIGSAFADSLAAGGHAVRRLVRGDARGDDVAWAPEDGAIDAAKLRGVDAVVHLAGEGIASGRWSADRKQRIRDSRVQGTDLLARTLAELSPRPSVLVCASAVGFYGPRGDEELDESAPPGTSFLPRPNRRARRASASSPRASASCSRRRAARSRRCSRRSASASADASDRGVSG
jgi:uncharacterized protein